MPLPHDQPARGDTSAAAALFAGPGEMRARCRTIDWNATPLGPVEAWPVSLRIAVQIVMASPQPMWIGWGHDLTQIFNDSYVPLAECVSAGLGRPARETWAEIWHLMGPDLERVRDGGPAEYDENRCIPLTRDGTAGEFYFSFSYSAIPDVAAPHGVGGVLAVAVETTALVRAARALDDYQSRQAFLLQLSDALRPLADRQAIQGEACRIVGEHLRTDRTYYVELDEARGIATVERDYVRGDAASLMGEHPMVVFAATVDAIRAGQPFVGANAATDSRIRDADRPAYLDRDIRSWVAVPIIKGGELVSAMCVTNGVARAWTPAEVTLLQQTAERTWEATARARADVTLRGSEERQAFVLRLSDALRAEDGVDAIGDRAVRMIADRLRLDRVYLVTLSPGDDEVVVTHEARREDMPRMLGSYRGSDFPSAMKEIFENTIVYDDIRTDARLSDLERRSFAGLGAVGFAAVPIRRGSEAPIWAVGAVSTRPRPWTAADVTLLEEAAERTWAALERGRAEAAVRESEEKYRTVLDSMEEAYCVIEMIFDDSGAPVDFRYLETNSAFVRHATMPMLGRRIMEIVPNFEPFWLERYGHVAKTGEPVHLEHVVQGLGDQWFETSAFRLGDDGSDRVVVFFANITARKRAEEALRESESRQIFLLTLSDALRSVADPQAIQQTALRIVAEHLHLDRVMFTETTGDDAWIDITSSYSREEFAQLNGRLPASEFGEALALLRTGNLFVVSDVDAEPTLSSRERATVRALGARAAIAVPVARGHRWVASLVVHHGIPRVWTPDEIALIEEAAERIWTAVERARAEAALRESEARYRALIDNISDYAIFLLDTSGNVTEWTPGAEHVKGYAAAEVLGRHFGMFYPDTERTGGVPEHELGVAIERGRLESEGWRVRKNGERFWADEIITPIHDASGNVVGFAKICRDLTHRMLVETATERQRQDREREEFRRQLAAVEEGERRRLSRELHDQLGQHLAALSLGLEEGRRVLSDGGARATLRAAVRLQALQELATTMTTDARNLALELRPPELDDVGLESALETYVTRWSARSHIHADVETAGLAAASLAPAVATAIYRIVQEALTNTLKHAAARYASVIVEHADGSVRLIIEDDGRGFDIDDVAMRVVAERGLGLAGMRERAALAGGVLTVESAPGSGTTIYVTFPTDVSTGAQRPERESASTSELVG